MSWREPDSISYPKIENSSSAAIPWDPVSFSDLIVWLSVLIRLHGSNRPACSNDEPTGSYEQGNRNPDAPHRHANSNGCPYAALNLGHRTFGS
jgi:hypothetical protein